MNYRRQDGALVVRTLRRRQWWQNLRPGHPVRLLVCGRPVDAAVDMPILRLLRSRAWGIADVHHADGRHAGTMIHRGPFAGPC